MSSLYTSMANTGHLNGPCTCAFKPKSSALWAVKGTVAQRETGTRLKDTHPRWHGCFFHPPGCCSSLLDQKVCRGPGRSHRALTAKPAPPQFLSTTHTPTTKPHTQVTCHSNLTKNSMWRNRSQGQVKSYFMNNQQLPAVSMKLAHGPEPTVKGAFTCRRE